MQIANTFLTFKIQVIIIELSELIEIKNSLVISEFKNLFWFFTFFLFNNNRNTTND